MSRPYSRLIGTSLAAIMAFAYQAGFTQATTRTWDGGGDGVSWGDGNNWDAPNTVPSDTVDSVTINTASTISIGGTRDLNTQTATLSNATFSTDALTFSNHQGTLTTSNVTFNSGVSIFKIAANTTFTNTFYNDTSTDWTTIGTNGSVSLQINGGLIKTRNVELKPNVSSTDTVTMTVDGTAAGHHYFNLLQVGSDGSVIGNTTFTAKNISAANYINTGSEAWGKTTGSTVATINLDNATIFLEGSWAINKTAVLNVKNSTMRWDQYGNLTNTQTSGANFDGEGLTIKVTTAEANRSYEVGGTEGGGLARFHDNYSIDSLILSGSTNALPLADAVDNNGGAADNQALYADKISLESNFAITTNSHKVYYKKLDLAGNTLTVDGGAYTSSANFIQVTGAALMPQTPYVTAHTSDMTTLVDESGTMATVSSDYGTIIVTGAYSGKTVRILLDVTGASGDIAALAADLGAQTSGFSSFIPPSLTGPSWDMMITYNGVADGSPLFFDWSFAYRNVTLNNVAAVPEPASAMLLGAGGLMLIKRRRLV